MLVPSSVDWSWRTLLLSLALPLSGWALIVDQYADGDGIYDRFSSGYPTSPAEQSGGVPTPVENDNLFGLGTAFDFSGVGWSSDSTRRFATLISPSFFVSATHSRPSVGSVISFLNSEGNIVQRTVLGYSATTFMGVTSDLTVGQLSAPITGSDHVSVYPLLFSGVSISATLDVLADNNPQTIVYGRGASSSSSSPRIGLNGWEIGPVSIDNPSVGGTGTDDTVIYLMLDDNTTGEALVQGGDSGGPSFILYDGVITLAGVHSVVANLEIDGQEYDATGDSSVHYYADQIEAILNGEGESLSLVSYSGASGFVTIIPVVVPEMASSGFLISSFTVCLIGVLRRRNR